MAIKYRFVKAEGEVLDYAFNWDAWLGSDTISTSVWTADTGITIDSESETTTVATIWLSGGRNNNVYQVKNKIVTASGRTAERSFNLTIEDR